MVKMHIKFSTALILFGVTIFVLIIGVVFFLTAKIGQKTRSGNEQLVVASRENSDNYQQIRRIRFINQLNGESSEIFMDGTVKYYDKNGKLVKTGRRGFAETQNIFKNFEWMINNNQTIEGGDYRIEIETQKGVVVVDPGGSNDDVDDATDFIDETLNPTPQPTAMPTIPPTASPTAAPTPTPDPSALPEYWTAPPFKCSDYYTGGKPIKISNIICGPDGN